MITAKDFTKAIGDRKPQFPGVYSCLLQSAETSQQFYVIGEYSLINAPDTFFVYGDIKEKVIVLGWLQLENAGTVAEQL